MIFEPVTVSWNGRDYRIPPEQVMRAIAKVEDVLTLGQLHEYTLSGHLPLAKLATAFGAVLRHAGAFVTDEEVYNGMFAGKGAALQTQAIQAVQMLQALMIPPEHIRAKLPAGKAEAVVKAPSSKRPSKPR